VPEVDIVRIKVGQDVTVNFDALIDKDYHGKVTNVARVGDIVAGVVNFNVTIELTDPDDLVLPAMTAAVNIVTEQIEDVILIPNRAIRSIDGVATVYVLKNSQAVPVAVTLGASSDTQSQLLKGDIQVGDLIILNPPTILMQSNSPGNGGGVLGGMVR